MKGWELEWKTKFSWGLEGWSCSIRPSNFIALYSILDSINRSFMLLMRIYQASHWKSHGFAEGDRTSPQKKASKTYIEDMLFNLTRKMVKNFWCDPCPWMFFCAEVPLVMSVKWYICSARGCSMRLSKLYNFRDSHLLYCLYVFLSSVILWHMEALGLKKFLTKGQTWNPNCLHSQLVYQL